MKRRLAQALITVSVILDIIVTTVMVIYPSVRLFLLILINAVIATFGVVMHAKANELERRLADLQKQQEERAQ